MNVLSPQSSANARHVVATQYFIYFAVLGILLPYFNLYCYHIGFSGVQIGIFSGLRSSLLVVFPLFWATLADRFRARKLIYVACSLLSAITVGGFLLTRDFYWMLLIAACNTVFYAPLISFLEAYAMDALGREKQRYGWMRVWGSISFILMVVVLGRLLDVIPIDSILVMILVGTALFALFTPLVPAGGSGSHHRPSLGAVGGYLMQFQVVIFLACAFLMLVSHGAYYGFFSIHLENLGFDKSFIGICWAVASGAEISVMLGSQRIFIRFPPKQVLLFSFFIAMLRWLALFFAHHPVALLASQVLHAITYGAFHIASILYIDQLTPAHHKTLGQAVNNAITYGLGLMVGFLLNGYLYERWGSFSLFLFSAGVALMGGVLFWGLGGGGYGRTRTVTD